MKTRIDPDELDLSQLREAVQSPGHTLIRQKLAATYSAELAKLATSENWDNTRYLQGVLAGLQTAAAIPGILETEIRARAQRKRKAANE